MNKFIYISIASFALSGCLKDQIRPVATPCVITPPEQTLVKQSTVLAVKVELESFVQTKISATPQLDFKKQAEETYQKLNDKDVACSMLLRTVACLAENRSDLRVQEFQGYLKETKACERDDDAKLSVDNVVQVSVNEAMIYEFPPIQVDLFVRNSGDKPAMITSVTARIDPHLEERRAPQSAQAVSTIYTVAINRTGANVKGAELNSPAKASYPYLTNPLLVVTTPIAQSLGPRSTDRFRIKYVFLGDFENKGPREKIEFIVNYNDGSANDVDPVKSSRLDIK